MIKMAESKDEKEFVELLKKVRIRIADKGEYRFFDKQAEEIAHKLFLEEGEQ